MYKTCKGDGDLCTYACTCTRTYIYIYTDTETDLLDICIYICIYMYIMYISNTDVCVTDSMQIHLLACRSLETKGCVASSGAAEPEIAGFE